MVDSRLKHLVAVARSGSFTKAAQAVGVTQSAVTKSIADLERQLGYSIFHRTSQGALLSEEGRDFVERAARLLDDARSLFDDSAVRGDRFAGVLKIGVCPASLEWRLTEPVARLLRQHSGIRYDISTSNFERMVQQVRNGAVDVAVGFDAAFGEWPELRRESVPSLETTLFVRTGHPLRARKAATLADLANYDFVSPSDSRPYGSIIRGIYESQGVDWHRRLHIIDYFPSVRLIVASSDAIGVVATSHANSRSFQTQFVTLDHLRLFPPYPLCCAVRARTEIKPAVRAFISAMCEDVSGAKKSIQGTRARA